MRGVSPLWIIPVLAVLGGLAVAVAIGKQITAEGRALRQEIAELRPLWPELRALFHSVDELGTTVVKTGRR